MNKHDSDDTSGGDSINLGPNMSADVTVDLQYGDSGKGKVVEALMREAFAAKQPYDLVMRYNGGGNAGHTIYKDGVKFDTHLVPAGVLHGIDSYIGPNCVLNVPKLMEEIKTMEDKGVDVKSHLKIATTAHVTNEAMLKADSLDSNNGSTGSGIRFTYAAKMLHDDGKMSGKNDWQVPEELRYQRAESVKELEQFLVEPFEMMFKSGKQRILGEGAQGFGLDVNHGNYPYVTSSNTTTAGMVESGVPLQTIDNVVGIVKAYETYVGKMPFQGDDPIFDKVGDAGKEYGVTTGRRRQVNWFNEAMFIRAALTNGINRLVVNKMDILDEVGAWGIRKTYEANGEVDNFDSAEAFEQAILKIAAKVGLGKDQVQFSRSPEEI